VNDTNAKSTRQMDRTQRLMTRCSSFHLLIVIRLWDYSTIALCVAVVVTDYNSYRPKSKVVDRSELVNKLLCLTGRCCAVLKS